MYGMTLDLWVAKWGAALAVALCAAHLRAGDDAETDDRGEPAQEDRWQYAVARMNRDAIQVTFDDRTVESYEQLDQELFDSHKPYFLMNARPAGPSPAGSEQVREAP